MQVTSIIATCCYSTPNRGAQYCDDCVRLFDSITPELCVGPSSKFFAHVTSPMSIAQSSSSSVAICYVLPFLWMTLCLYKMARNR